MGEKAFHILGIAGSLRQESYNRGLLRAAQELAPAGVEIQLFDLAPIPPFNADVEAKGDPEPVRQLKESIRTADAMLIATPEYNYSVPGVLKNAIDWASRPPAKSVLYHKPVAIMGASPGRFGTARGQLALRQVFLFTKCHVLIEPEVYVFKAGKRFGADGKLIDEDTRRRIRDLLDSLLRWAQQLQAR